VPTNQDKWQPDAWQPLLARHRAALFLLARQYLSNPQDAEDAVQEGFIKFWNARHKANDAAAYLYTCVRTSAIDFRRSRVTRQRYESATPAPPPQPLFTAPLEQSERRDQIEAALQRLSQDQREVLVLKVWADLTFAQIAEALGVPVSTAASRYRYAVQHLGLVLTREVVCD
jgi:RNA polymerase sigma-70 factor (ECF subfamily)